MGDDADLPDEKGPERTCIVTRRSGSPDGLIRFVLSPDGGVVPDLRARLPGRGAWVDTNAGTLAEAVRRKAFARAFKRPVQAAASLPVEVDGLLARDALQGLAFANKAGRVVCGTGKVESALAAGGVAALLRATDAAPDGSRKLDAAARRAAEKGVPPPVVQIFESHQLDLALGRSNVIHAALLIGGVSDAFLKRAARLSRFRGLASHGVAGTTDNPIPDETEASAGDGREVSVGG